MEMLTLAPPSHPSPKQDDGKAGMEEDHTYEVRGRSANSPGHHLWMWSGDGPGLTSVSCLQGLDIDQTATYEDIVTLRTGEVKWSVGEHPGQE